MGSTVITESERLLKHHLEGKCGVYIIETPGGDCYVGSAINIWRRYLTHKTALKRMVHNSKGLQAEFDLYGIASFKFEILRLCGKRELLYYEQMAINELRPRHNSSLSSKGLRGVSPSEETRRKMSLAKKGKPGKPNSSETRAKLSALSTERHKSPEYRQMISDARRGFRVSEETKAKLSALNKGKPSNRKGVVLTEEQKAKMSAAQKARWEKIRAAAAPQEG